MSILTWCKWFIRLCSPNSFSDDICGDLEEEHTTISQSIKGKSNADLWMIQQTLKICIHFILSKNNLLSLLVSVAAISISFTMIVSVSWLSDLEDASVLSDAFWQQWLNGSTYQIFLEPVLWQSAPQAWSQPVDWNMWFYQPSVIYALISFYTLYKITAKLHLSITEYSLVSMLTLLIPYLIGNALFFFMDIKMTEAGPIVAFMWISTLYLILPISYQFINRLRMSERCFT
ncbi:MAG: hypothetical protein HRT54_18525 [Colwellia sp.]|nr:hypothetical protein [Colwellia sp.]